MVYNCSNTQCRKIIAKIPGIFFGYFPQFFHRNWTIFRFQFHTPFQKQFYYTDETRQLLHCHRCSVPTRRYLAGKWSFDFVDRVPENVHVGATRRKRAVRVKIMCGYQCEVWKTRPRPVCAVPKPHRREQRGDDTSSRQFCGSRIIFCPRLRVSETQRTLFAMVPA